MQLIISLGANLGNTAHNLHDALQQFMALAKASEFRVSDPFINPALLHPNNAKAQPDFTNIVAICETKLTPDNLLNIAKKIEASFGRDFSAPVWSARPMDIDLIDYGMMRWHSNRLILPHPCAHRRNFVIQPLRQLVNVDSYWWMHNNTM